MGDKDVKKKEEELTLSQRFNVFVQKNRKPLFIGFIALLVMLGAFIVAVTVMEKSQEKAISEVDSLNRKYLELKTYITSEDPEDISKQAELVLLLIELGEFQKKHNGFAAARAYCISAEIFTEQKNWIQAEDAWLSAEKNAGKSHLAPIAIFNAAVAAEEQGNIQDAIDHYSKALAYGNNFVSVARAQFSIGRLEEGRNNTDAALEAYQSLLAKWPDQIWSNLAQNRILVLSD